MQRIIFIALTTAAAASLATTVTWVPSSWSSELIHEPSDSVNGLWVVPLPQGLSGAYNLSLIDFVLYDQNLYKLCTSTMLTVEGATNQASLAQKWGTFYMGAEFVYTANAPSSYDATQRAQQPCNNMGGGGRQKTLWQIPAGNTAQFNLSFVVYQQNPVLDALLTNWELELELTKP